MIQLLQRSSKRVGETPHADQVNTALLSLKAAGEQIVRTTRMCETLRQSIVSLQANLKTLDDICGLIDDPAAREALQHQMELISAILELRSAELSSIERMLQALSHRAHPLSLSSSAN